MGVKKNTAVSVMTISVTTAALQMIWHKKIKRFFIQLHAENFFFLQIAIYEKIREFKNYFLTFKSFASLILFEF